MKRYWVSQTYLVLKTVTIEVQAENEEAAKEAIYEGQDVTLIEEYEDIWGDGEVDTEVEEVPSHPEPLVSAPGSP